MVPHPLTATRLVGDDRDPRLLLRIYPELVHAATACQVMLGWRPRGDPSQMTERGVEARRITALRR